VFKFVHTVLFISITAPKVDQLTLTSCDVEWQSVRPMGEDRILYMLQLQCRDHEYRQASAPLAVKIKPWKNEKHKQYSTGFK